MGGPWRRDDMENSTTWKGADNPRLTMLATVGLMGLLQLRVNSVLIIRTISRWAWASIAG